MAGILETQGARPYDETSAHAAYAPLLRRFEHADLRELAADVQQALEDRGCAFLSEGGERRFVVDPVPRVIDGDEWEQVAAGLRQRVEALERFVADAHGDGEIVAAGVVPERVLSSCEHFDPALRGLPVGRWITIAGLDLVRCADGRFAVLEDNVRTPSGLAYLMAARHAVSRHVVLPAGARLREVGGLVEALRDALAAAAPEDTDEPFAILLSDGPRSAAFWEHETLGDDLGIPVVTPDRLRCRNGRLWLRCGRKRRPVDVVYRRTDDERLHEAGGAPTALGRLLEAPLRAGTLAVVNAFGTGVADDKLVHAYVEEMIRFYLREEPELRSVRTFDLADDRTRGEVLANLDELVVKPRCGQGGEGVVIGPLAGDDELRRVRDAVTEAPEGFVAQEVVLLSEHPTVSGGRLAPRHVDLRPFVISGATARHVVPGGLTRVALQEGEMVVNSSRNGGAKDTWVLG